MAAAGDTFEPRIVADRHGESVTIRLAVREDLAAVEEHIADHSGTGSGVGGDAFLIQEFQNNVASPTYTVLFAENTGDRRGLGILAIAWASPTESYWQSLRVSQEARGRGIAKLIFAVASQLCVGRQGAGCVARWGVVSNNEVMTGWSARMNLHGPTAFIRHSASPLAEGDAAAALPDGLTMRRASEADVPAVMAAARGFLLAKSTFGSQNFLRCGWGEFNEAELRVATSGVPAEEGGLPPPTPRLLLEAGGAIVGIANISLVKFGEVTYLMHKYMDAATTEAFGALANALPLMGREEGCDMIGGYVPTIGWVVDFFRASPLFERATETEQHEFHWRPADFVAGS